MLRGERQSGAGKRRSRFASPSSLRRREEVHHELQEVSLLLGCPVLLEGERQEDDSVSALEGKSVRLARVVCEDRDGRRDWSDLIHEVVAEHGGVNGHLAHPGSQGSSDTVDILCRLVVLRLGS